MVSIATHQDADGISAAALYLHAFDLDLDDVEINMPEEFGDVEDEDVVLDMKPLNPDYEGTVYDHHLNHPKKRAYELHHMEIPAAGIVWKKHRKTIPKKHWWKVAIGMAGDGQTEKTPVKVIKKSPLLMERVLWTRQNYGKTIVTAVPIISTLSSPVNALCRTGKPMKALEMVYNAQTPFDIYSKSAIEAKKAVRMEVEDVFKGFGSYFPQPVRIKDRFTICEYESDYRIGGLVAIKLNEADKSTVIALNRRNGTMSIRGILASYAVEILTENGMKAGGHAGFAGGRVTEDQDIEDLVEIFCKA